MCIRDRYQRRVHGDIRAGRYFISNPKEEVEETSAQESRGVIGVLKDLIIGFQEARNPWILIAFFSVFLAGVQQEIGQKIFVLWIQSFYDNTDEGKAAGYAKVTSISAFGQIASLIVIVLGCLLYTSPSPRDRQKSRMPSSA
eukprot:TRINITY_DN3166_c0_g4_i1.p1 TRINITY_DN3166_c0_g4~~TRINITY_DN3166_c0_g4_i1.p1  ORF type:complete len:142 (+),score=35.48 TRINITY_DN3166_c0_g4_i1:66-491(+)